jgi:hypothetical protein
MLGRIARLFEVSRGKKHRSRVGCSRVRRNALQRDALFLEPLERRELLTVSILTSPDRNRARLDLPSSLDPRT